ncbi:SusC/RagA family TonB-linked outer membrane protein [Pedobacter metabolipauper]|uniref:SusC/RagA family TonB-linked outer membrane protein n=1 Tax=Pedobacter metabolipauper TaxID=425513 RepID=UPI001AAD6241|nr:TonB-dependent receptor [Pedobacter metabolipauper]
MKYLCYLLPLLFSVNEASAQTPVVISGKVTDVKGLPLPGVSVVLKNSAAGSTTDSAGRYALNAPNLKGTLVFTFIGFVKQELPVNDSKIVNATLAEENSTLNEVVVVAFGTQKRESMVSSITTINPKELKGPTSNLTTMLAGRLPGLIAYQRSGEPGSDNAAFFIRGITSFGTGKQDPLILIDNMESTPNALARMQPDDIASFSILKDAAASSLYGARGANGVVLVTTKSGSEGTAKFNVRFENSVSTNTQNFQMADNITYMRLANEAALTRNPIAPLPYLENKIDHTIAGDNPLLYPNNDWMDLLIKDHTQNQRLNLNVGGGGKVARYYIAGTFNQDNGVLKSNAINSFDNNIKLKSYSVRSNVNVNLTSTTEAVVRTSGSFDDFNGPIGGGSAIFNSVLTANPVKFPALFNPSDSPFDNHPLFGGALLTDQTSGGYYNNPYASMVSGFQQYNTSTLNVQLELNQDFKFITPGLKASVMAYTTRYSYFDLSRQYNPFFYSANPTDQNAKGYNIALLNELTATEYLNYTPGAKTVNTTAQINANISYAHTYGQKHNVSALLVGIAKNYLDGNATTLQGALPSRNLGVSGRLTYDYDTRYLFEANFGYNGSERFAENNRYGFFPSVGAGWNISNEKFFEPLRNVVSRFKVRGSYGLVGNDQIGSIADRFFYLSDVSLNNAARSATFGENFTYTRNGVVISRYANNEITWEKSKDLNLAVDLTFLNKFNLVVEGYKKDRTNILMPRANIPTTMGLTAISRANVGAASAKGVDVSMDYYDTFGDFWLNTRGTFTFSTSKLEINEEPEFPANEYYLSKVGHSLSAAYGLIAERLFVDDEDVRNSPVQSFGGASTSVRGGDIKYRDLNGDGIISGLDMVSGIGNPTSPEIIYGFGFSSGYKNFEFSAQFQGSARSSIFVNPAAVTPFALSGGNQNGLLQVIADNHWSEDNRDIYSFWPRLSSTVNVNNSQPSTWWLRNGAFLRLKQVEVAYNIREKGLKKLRMSSLRFYVNANNLFVITGFKLWDPEQGGNGLGYPVQKVFNAGLTVSF